MREDLWLRMEDRRRTLPIPPCFVQWNTMKGIPTPSVNPKVKRPHTHKHTPQSLVSVCVNDTFISKSSRNTTLVLISGTAEGVHFSLSSSAHTLFPNVLYCCLLVLNSYLYCTVYTILFAVVILLQTIKYQTVISFECK